MLLACRWLIVGVHEPKYSSTLPSSEFATGAHLSSEIENELGRAILPSSPRTGYLGYQMITAMEPLFYQYGVDLVSLCCMYYNLHMEHVLHMKCLILVTMLVVVS